MRKILSVIFAAAVLFISVRGMAGDTLPSVESLTIVLMKSADFGGVWNSDLFSVAGRVSYPAEDYLKIQSFDITTQPSTPLLHSADGAESKTDQYCKNDSQASVEFWKKECAKAKTDIEAFCKQLKDADLYYYYVDKGVGQYDKFDSYCKKSGNSGVVDYQKVKKPTSDVDCSKKPGELTESEQTHCAKWSALNYYTSNVDCSKKFDNLEKSEKTYCAKWFALKYLSSCAEEKTKYKGFQNFSCSFFTGQNKTLSTDSKIVIRLTDKDGDIFDTSAILLSAAQDGKMVMQSLAATAIDGIVGLITGNTKDSQTGLDTADTDGDGVPDAKDKFPSIPNSDQSSVVSVASSCSDEVLGSIAIRSVKEDGDSEKFGIEIYLPKGGKIVGDFSAVVGNRKVEIACSAVDSGKASATKGGGIVSLWDETDTALTDLLKEPAYRCTVKDAKASDILGVSFTYQDPSGKTCLIGGNGGSTLDMSKSVSVESENVGGGSGGDCSLNPNTAGGGIGWLIDALILGLPAALIGFKRRGF